jgi:hypothetical protein
VTNVTWFVLGFFLGAFFGLCLMAVLACGARGDAHLRKMGREE